jgi:5-methylcytosine-specific restriction enzyme A
MPWANDREARRRSDANYGTAWRKKRHEALRRANWRCEIRFEGCTTKATEVDHILGVANDPTHSQLRAGCKSCHGKVTAEQGHTARWAGGAPSRDPAPQPKTAW